MMLLDSKAFRCGIRAGSCCGTPDRKQLHWGKTLAIASLAMNGATRKSASHDSPTPCVCAGHFFTCVNVTDHTNVSLDFTFMPWNKTMSVMKWPGL